jgi:hypothetical protein
MRFAIFASSVSRVSFHAAKSLGEYSAILCGLFFGFSVAPSAKPADGQRVGISEEVMPVKVFLFCWHQALFAMRWFYELAVANGIADALTCKSFGSISIVANGARFVLLRSEAVVNLLVGALAVPTHTSAESIFRPRFTTSAIVASLHIAESRVSLA